MDPIFHIVLHQPEIPNNTGNIGRTCIATGCALHLIRPLGFDTSVKACRRAGLDYWPRLAPIEHDDWQAYERWRPPCGAGILPASAASNPTRLPSATPPRRWLFTTRAARPLWDAAFQPGDHLVFGSETAGLPAPLLGRFSDSLLTFPMVPGERSLNLATAVCAAVYEGIRQLAARGGLTLDDTGRLRTQA